MTDRDKITDIPEVINKYPLTKEDVYERVESTKAHINADVMISEANIPKKRGRKPKTSSDDLPLTESTEVKPLTDIITTELGKYNITEQALLTMETEYKALTINGVSDREGYDLVNKARISCKNTRVLTTKLCKEGRDEAIKIQKSWINKEKEIVGRIEVVENELAAKQKIIDDIKEEEKRQRELKEQVILNERAAKLMRLGMTFEGDAYILEEIRISVTAIKNYDEFTFTNLVAGVEKKFKEKEEIRLEQERQKEAETLELKRIAEENLARQEALRRQEEEMQARLKAIEEAEARQKAEAERIIKEKEAAEQAKTVAQKEAERKALEELIKSRKSQLFQLGFSQQNDLLLFKSISVSDEVIKSSDNDEWLATLNDLTTKSIEIKEQIEKDRLAEIERIKEESTRRERERIEAENAAKLKKEAEAKEKLERERLLAEAEAKRIADAAPDLNKLNNYLKVINSVPMPEFATDSYKEYLVTIVATKNQFLSHIFKNKPL